VPAGGFPAPSPALEALLLFCSVGMDPRQDPPQSCARGQSPLLFLSCPYLPAATLNSSSNAQ
jgi:hypothetical protein